MASCLSVLASCLSALGSRVAAAVSSCFSVAASKFYRCLLYLGVHQRNTTEIINTASMWVDFEDYWFTQGHSRHVYRGTYQGDRRVEGKPCVVKVYKEEWYLNNDREEYTWRVDQRAYDKAHEMARDFNEQCQTSKAIQFVRPEFTSIKVSQFIPINAMVAIEMYLDGKDFEKFSSNVGYVNPVAMASPAAFSHFTYHTSGGKVLVCKLQGIRSSAWYKFSAPAIQSGGMELGEYGPSDLGKFGILAFFDDHCCNDLCKGWKKPQIIDLSPEQGNLLDKIMSAMRSERSSKRTCYLNELTDVPVEQIVQIHSTLRLEAVHVS
ncbi:alpha-protein kinase vwkA-like isoform X3 [Acanthaster planci]|uniref:Alpha-protein kinase vwkA-like isoform X3 n=1 Tax=Acanthaster planci TaxID=133434 RepID=A0A8B7YW50_ACAPL|nr:alpha-protein kinase vwkA-like isoform X3 [Acanthaster planci]